MVMHKGGDGKASYFEEGKKEEGRMKGGTDGRQRSIQGCMG